MDKPFKFLRMSEETYRRLVKHGAGNGKTFNYVVSEALDALDDKKHLENKNNG